MNEEPRRSGVDHGGGDSPAEGGDSSVLPRLIAAGLLAAALVLFVVQNRGEVDFKWLRFDMTGPLWLVIVVAVMAGVVLSEVLGFFRRRRKRRR